MNRNLQNNQSHRQKKRFSGNNSLLTLLTNVRFKKISEYCFIQYSACQMQNTKRHRMLKPVQHEIRSFGCPKSFDNGGMEQKHTKLKRKYHFSNKNDSNKAFAMKVTPVNELHWLTLITEQSYLVYGDYSTSD